MAGNSAMASIDYRPLIVQVAKEEGIDPERALKLAYHESRFNPKATSPKGAMGLMQIMPGTWATLKNEMPELKDPYNAEQSIRGGMRYLRKMQDMFGPDLAIAAYNAGPGAIKKYGGVPPYAETQAYFKNITGNASGSAQYQPRIQQVGPTREAASQIEPPQSSLVSDILGLIGPTEAGAADIPKASDIKDVVTDEELDSLKYSPVEHKPDVTGQDVVTDEELDNLKYIPKPEPPKIWKDYMPEAGPEAEWMKGGTEGAQFGRGMVRGAAALAGKYGSMVDPNIGHAFGMQVPPAEAESREDQAKRITGALLNISGIDQSKDAEPVTATEKFFRGMGESAAPIAEIAGLGALMGPAMGAEGFAGQALPWMSRALSTPGATSAGELPSWLLGQRVGGALTRAAPTLANYAAPAAKGAAILGTSGLLDPYDPLGAARRGLIHGAAFGAASRLAQGIRPDSLAAQAVASGSVGGGISAWEGRRGSDLVADTAVAAALPLVSRISENYLPSAAENISTQIREGVAKAIRPSVEGKKSLPLLNKWKQHSENALKDLYWNMKDGSIEILDSRGNPLKYPRTLEDTLEGTTKLFWKYANETNAAMESANGVGLLIDNKPIVEALRAQGKKRSLQEDRPDVVADALRRAHTIEENGPYTVAQANEKISEFNNNQNMQNFHKNPNKDTGLLVANDAIQADLLRKGLYKAVESAEGPGFAPARKAMADLKAIEPALAHRVVVASRSAPKGLIESLDPVIVLHAARAIATGDVAGIVASVLAKGKMIRNRLANNPDNIIHNTFRRMDKVLGPRPEPSPEPEPFTGPPEFTGPPLPPPQPPKPGYEPPATQYNRTASPLPAEGTQRGLPNGTFGPLRRFEIVPTVGPNVPLISEAVLNPRPVESPGITSGGSAPLPPTGGRPEPYGPPQWANQYRIVQSGVPVESASQVPIRQQVTPNPATVSSPSLANEPAAPLPPMPKITPVPKNASPYEKLIQPQLEAMRSRLLRADMKAEQSRVMMEFSDFFRAIKESGDIARVEAFRKSLNRVAPQSFVELFFPGEPSGNSGPIPALQSMAEGTGVSGPVMQSSQTVNHPISTQPPRERVMQPEPPSTLETKYPSQVDQRRRDPERLLTLEEIMRKANK